jgi:hypothetical protein
MTFSKIGIRRDGRDERRTHGEACDLSRRSMRGQHRRQPPHTLTAALGFE